MSTPTNPPTNPLVGAIYIDQTTNLTWIWSGTFWIQTGDGGQYNAHVGPGTTLVPGYYAEPAPETWLPQIGPTAPTASLCGQLWVDTSVSPNNVYVWDCNTGMFLPIVSSSTGAEHIISSVAPTTRADLSALQGGDLWTNPTTQQMSYWNGTAWVASSSPDTNSIAASAQPATRIDGTALVAGDLWTDLDNNIIYYFDGATFVPVTAKCDNLFLAAGPTEPTTRPSGEALVDGDTWIDSTNGVSYYRESGAWKPSTDLHSFSGSGDPVSTNPITTRNDRSALIAGDLYLDTAVGALYGYNGTTWVSFVSADTHSIRSSTQPVIRPGGGPFLDGDMWVESDADNLLRVYNAGTTTWEVVAPDKHSLFGATIPSPALTRPDSAPLLVGDQYLNTSTGLLYAWNGTAWILLTSPDTHSIRAAVKPTIRLDGSALQDGDMWVDDSAGNVLYSYNGVIADFELVGSDLHSFWGTAAPSLTTRPDGTPLVIGDQFLDTTSKLLYGYVGGVTPWVLIGSDKHSFTGTVVTPPLTTDRPDNTPLQAGDQWFNTTTGVLYGWTGSAWIEIGANDKHSFTGAGTPYIATPSIGTNTVTLRPDGTALVVGDHYVDTNTKVLYYYTGSEWEILSADLHSFYGSGAPTLTLRPNGSPLVTGDQYLDSANNLLYAYNGSAWVIISGDSHSFTGAGTPYIATPSVGTNTVTVRPDGSGLVAGDHYVDTNTNILYYYTGSEWQEISDDTHAFTGTAAPALTARPDGSPLKDGDIFINRTTEEAYYYDLGATAWVKFGDDTHSFSGSGVPTLTTRPDTSALRTGDQYLDTATNYLWAWDGTVWVVLTRDTHSFTGSANPTLTTRSDGNALLTGDQYINTTTDILFYWNGSAWEVLDNDTHSFTGAGTPFVSTPSVGTNTTTTRPDGTALVAGDQYVDTNTKVLYYYTGSEWEEISLDTHSFTGTANPTLTARPNGSALIVGDQYINTTTDILFYWNGSAWEVLDNDTHSFAGSGTPYISTPSTGTNSQTTRPDGTALVTGDQYVDTATDTLYYYNGTEWETLSSVDTHSFTGSGTPYISTPSAGTNPQSTRPDSTALITGDQYVDTATDTLYYYNGSDWEALKTIDTHSFTGSGTPYIATPSVGTNTQTTRPDGSALLTGDMYVNTSDKTIFFYSGAEWSLASENTHSYMGNGAPTLTTRPTGEALIDGDMYVDYTNGPYNLYVRYANIWRKVNEGTDLMAMIGTIHPSQPASLVDNTTRQDNVTTLLDGDMYVDTSAGQGQNQLYFWDSTAAGTVPDPKWSRLGPNSVMSTSSFPATFGGYNDSLVKGDTLVYTPTKVVTSDAQIERRYFWDGVAWVPIGPYTFQSDSPPDTSTGANLVFQGDTWIKATDGTTYIWYYDQPTSSNYWLQIA